MWCVSVVCVCVCEYVVWCVCVCVCLCEQICEGVRRTLVVIKGDRVHVFCTCDC